MSQIKTKFITDLAVTTAKIAADAVTSAKIRLNNNQALRARNSANSADVDVLKLSTANEIILGTDTMPGADNSFNLGSQALTWSTIYGTELRSSDTGPVISLSNGILSDSSGVAALSFESRLLRDAANNIVLNWAATNILALTNISMQAQAEMRFADADSSNYAAIKAPATIASNYTLTLPADDGSSGQVLSTDGSGVLSWISASSSPSGATRVRVNIDANIDRNNPGTATFDGIPLNPGDLVVLTNQVAQEENGVYIFDTDVTPLVRQTDWDTAAEFVPGRMVFVAEGDRYRNDIFTLREPVAILDTTAVLFATTGFDPQFIPSTLLPYADAVLDIGSSSRAFSTAYVSSVTLDSIVAKVSVNGIRLNDYAKFSGNGGTGQNPLRFYEAADTNYVALRAPDTVVSTTTWTLPDQDGTTGQVLSTDGAGILSWATASGATILKETFTLNGTDITNQLVTLANLPVQDSVDFYVRGGGIQQEGASFDYSVNYATGEVTFLNDLATGGPSALIAGDILVIKYEY